MNQINTVSKRVVAGQGAAGRRIVAGIAALVVLGAGAPAAAFEKGGGQVPGVAPISAPVATSAPVAANTPAEVPTGFDGSAAANVGLPFDGSLQLGGRVQLGSRVLPFLGVGLRAGYDRVIFPDTPGLSDDRITVGGYVDLHLGALSNNRRVDAFFGLGVESSTEVLGLRGYTGNGYLQSVAVPVRGGVNIHGSARFAFHWFVEITPYIPVTCSTNHCGDTQWWFNTGIGFAWNDVRQPDAH